MISLAMIRPVVELIVTLFAIIFSSNILLPSAWAAVITWHAVGPGGGGWIESIACDPKSPNTVYAGADLGGFYSSEDGGKNWRIQNEGLKDLFVERIAINPLNSNIILLGTQGGIYKSIDKGRTWSRKGSGFPPIATFSYSSPIGALAFDPSNPAIVYAGIGRNRTLDAGQGKLYKSLDGGENWSICSNKEQIPSDANFSDIVVSVDGKYILAISNRGVFRSIDKGASWSSSNQGLLHTECQKASISASNTNVCYLTLRTKVDSSGIVQGGVYRSNDQGKTWFQCSGNLPYTIGKVGADPLSTTNYREIVIHPQNPEVANVGANSWANGGIYETTDGGKSWRCKTVKDGKASNMNYGWLTQWGPSVTCVSRSPSNPEVIYFGTAGHVFATHNSGQSWEQIYTNILPDSYVVGNGLETTCAVSATFSTSAPQNVYLYYQDIGLFLSDSLWERMTRLSLGMSYSGNIFHVVTDPVDSNKVWAATGEWAAADKGNVCLSIDRGKTWSVTGSPGSGLPEGRVVRLALDPKSPQTNRTLYAASLKWGVYKSIDNGRSWKAANNGLPFAAQSNTRIVDLMLNSESSNRMICLIGNSSGNDGTIYSTEDGGSNWTRVPLSGASLGNVQSLGMDPKDWDTVYLCQKEIYIPSTMKTIRGGVYKISTSGKTCTLLYAHPFPTCLTVHPTNPKRLYLGTTDNPYHDDNEGTGILKSEDGGSTWQLENSGLTCKKIKSITISPIDPSQIIVGTSGNGFFIGYDKLNLAPPVNFSIKTILSN